MWLTAAGQHKGVTPALRPLADGGPDPNLGFLLGQHHQGHTLDTGAPMQPLHEGIEDSVDIHGRPYHQLQVINRQLEQLQIRLQQGLGLGLRDAL